MRTRQDMPPTVARTQGEKVMELAAYALLAFVMGPFVLIGLWGVFVLWKIIIQWTLWI